MPKNFKKIFYLNLKHKNKTYCITYAHLDVLRMLISAKRGLGLPINSRRLVSAQQRLMVSRGSLPRMKSGSGAPVLLNVWGQGNWVEKTRLKVTSLREYEKTFRQGESKKRKWYHTYSTQQTYPLTWFYTNLGQGQELSMHYCGQIFYDLFETDKTFLHIRHIKRQLSKLSIWVDTF